MSRGVRGLDRHRPDDDERAAVRPPASASSTRSWPTRARSSGSSPGRPRPAARPDRSPTARSPPTPPATSSPGRRASGSSRTSTISSGSSSRPTTRAPRTTRRSSAPGRRRRRSPDLAPAPGLEGHLGRREEPIPEAVLAEARRRFAGRAAVTISHPRFLEFLAPGVSKARRRPAPRAPGRRAARRRAGDRRPVQRPRDDRRRRARRGDAARARRGPGGRPVHRAAAGEEGVAQLIERLVLAARPRPPERRAGSRPSTPPPPSHGLGRVTARVVPDDAAGRASAVGALRAGGIVALPTDTVYGIAVALETPGGIEALFAAKDRPPDRAIMLLLADAAQAPTIGSGRRRGRACRRVLAGRPDARRPAAARRRLAGRAHRRVPHDRPARPGPRRRHARSRRRSARCRRPPQIVPDCRRRATPRGSSASSAMRSRSSSTAARPAAARRRPSSIARRSRRGSSERARSRGGRRGGARRGGRASDAGLHAGLAAVASRSRDPAVGR